MASGSFANEQKLLSSVQQTIQSYSPEIVLFSPLVSAALDYAGYGYDSFPLDDGTVPLLCATGGGVIGSGLFDVVFVPEPGAGWEDAASVLASNGDATPLMTAVVYKEGDSDGEAAYRYFQQKFPANRLLEEVQQDAKGSRWTDSVLNEFAKYSVLQVVVPAVDRFDAFFNADYGLAWVTDVRYASVVPDNRLEGVVCDDLGATIAPLLTGNTQSSRRGMTLPLTLVRQYEKARTGLRSLF